MPKNGVARSWRRLIPIFLSNLHIDFHSNYISFHSYQQLVNVSLVHSEPSLICLLVLAILTGVTWTRKVVLFTLPCLLRMSVTLFFSLTEEVRTISMYLTRTFFIFSFCCYDTILHQKAFYKRKGFFSLQLWITIRQWGKSRHECRAQSCKPVGYS